MTTLDVNVTLALGSLDLHVELTAQPGEVIALLGPNGAGKTTLLRCITGMAPIDSGHIRFGEQVWDDPSANIFIAPEQRGIGMVFQDYVLFEHMSVLDNVAFPLRNRGASKQESRVQARAQLEHFDLADLAKERPGALSGGQSQRVALARAQIGAPKLLLLDEPFSALDAAVRPVVRSAIAEAAADRVTILVTHDPVDVADIATRVIELVDGRIKP
ncbi:MAG: ATP-binding cassette domain-containing protein [Actinobacteria bacterium]|nr:ATP-binding cassette domain-containing protein [Actinomycetota bacterium]